MVGATASTTFSNGHFCGALRICLVVAFHGASGLPTSFCSDGEALHQAGNGLERRSATIGASTAHMPTSS
jgi:hypothetical protein